MPKRSEPSRLAVGAATLVGVVALWYVLTQATHIIPSVYFATPAEVLQAAKQITIQGYADGRLHEHFLHSCWLVLMGFAVAVTTGVPLGMLMGWSHRAEALINPVFLLLRPIPPLAWIPLAIVWLGLGDAAKVLVIWFAAFVPAVINSYAGVRSIEPYLIEAARSLGVRRAMLVREVLIIRDERARGAHPARVHRVELCGPARVPRHLGAGLGDGPGTTSVPATAVVGRSEVRGVDA